jgi:hypothetical protein
MKCHHDNPPIGIIFGHLSRPVLTAGQRTSALTILTRSLPMRLSV